MKTFSRILTLFLLLFCTFFVAELLKECYVCDPSSKPKSLTGEFEKPAAIFVIVNFAFAIFSAYLMIKGRFNTSAVVSGIVVGLQVVVFVMVMLIGS